MDFPRIVIVGRPNVGKSTLFNKISGKRKSIVHNIPGVTRDVIEEVSEWKNKKFLLVDTGGITITEKDWLSEKIRERVINEIEKANLVIFMLDGREGVTALDEEISKLLQKHREKVIVAVNKIDNPTPDERMAEFFSLGFEDVIALSAQHGTGVAELLDLIYERIKKYLEEGVDKTDIIKLSFVGRPNTGKSSIINKLLKEERVIVSSEAGTTRDAVDIPFEWRGKHFLLIDTAGIRRPSKVGYGIEFFSVGRSIHTIEKSDIVCLVIDCTEGITKQDKRIAGLVERRRKGLIIVVNKKDLCHSNHETLIDYVRKELFFVDYAPIVYTSALKGEGIESILKISLSVYEDFTKRLKTSRVNNIIRKIFQEKKPPVYKNKQIKVFFSFQKGIKPPTFVIITNFKEGWKKNYMKFFERKFKEYSGIKMSPIGLIIEERKN